jgi:hypothetical protein
MRTFAVTLRGHASAGIDRLASLALDAGFSRLVLGAPLHQFHWEKLEGLLPRESIAAIEAFLPYPRTVRPGSASPFELAPLHPEARRDSVKQGQETILLAERRSVPLVLFPPARLEDVSRSDFFGSGRERPSSEKLALLLERRRQEARPRVDALLMLLSKLLPVADRYDVRLALVPSGLPDEVPILDEAEAALREFEGAPLGIWLDSSRVAADLWRDPSALARWELLAAASEGATLGEGAADLPRSILEPSRVWAIDPPGQGFEEAVSGGRAFLEGLDRGPGTKVAQGGILGP